MSRFEGQVVVVTGAMGGLGTASVRLFASKGAIVHAWDVRTNGQRDQENGMSIVYESVDVTDIDAVERCVGAIVALHKKIDVLINNAGVVLDSTLSKMSREQWDTVIDVNLGGVFNTCKAVVPAMRNNSYGRIINTASVIGVYGNFGQVNYAASKAGLIGFTRSLAREVGSKGITVNAVAPGFIDTEMVKGMPPHVLKSVVDRTPAGRLGRPEEVASLYGYLASREAAFINGAVISIDGGYVG